MQRKIELAVATKEGDVPKTITATMVNVWPKDIVYKPPKIVAAPAKKSICDDELPCR